MKIILGLMIIAIIIAYFLRPEKDSKYIKDTPVKRKQTAEILN